MFEGALARMEAQAQNPQRQPTFNALLASDSKELQAIVARQQKQIEELKLQRSELETEKMILDKKVMSERMRYKELQAKQ